MKNQSDECFVNKTIEFAHPLPKGSIIINHFFLNEQKNEIETDLKVAYRAYREFENSSARLAAVAFGNEVVGISTHPSGSTGIWVPLGHKDLGELHTLRYRPEWNVFTIWNMVLEFEAAVKRLERLTLSASPNSPDPFTMLGFVPPAQAGLEDR